VSALLLERLEADGLTPGEIEAALGTEHGRRAITRERPDLFALIYLRDHLRSEETGNEVTFSYVHDEWCAHARSWMEPLGGPMEQRDAEIGPRSMGKSTWFFLILPMWAAAHGHVRFAAAFADSATQAETHLQTFKNELDRNALLRQDFPALVSPARRPTGVQVADNRAMLYTRSGFVFAARGIDSGNLGLKVGSLRPDLLILDDVEPGESNYSALQMDKRLTTIRDVVFPLNVNARVVIIGTVTMPGSIIHQLVRSTRLGTEVPEWITEERIRVHFYPPFVKADDGTEESVWPGRWSFEFLDSIRHTRGFAKNYANDPMGHDGAYWSTSDFDHVEDIPGITRRILSIDPAVTTKKSSDPTGLAVVAYSAMTGRCLVERSISVKYTGKELRDFALTIISLGEDLGRPIGGILVETNQGGDLWKNDVFHNMPVPVKVVHQDEKKEIRAAEALAHYQRKKVSHRGFLVSAEEQMVAFPNAPHDDEVDAIGTGVNHFLTPVLKKRVGAKVSSYV
jgi:hypothetical protein